MTILSKDVWDVMTFTERELWLINIGYSKCHAYNNKKHSYYNLSSWIRARLELDMKDDKNV